MSNNRTPKNMAAQDLADAIARFAIAHVEAAHEFDPIPFDVPGASAEVAQALEAYLDLYFKGREATKT